MKFKVWNIKRQCFENTEQKYFLSCDGKIHHYYEGKLKDVTDEFEIKLFTGFFDKDRNEIYEGDYLGRKYNKVEYSFGCFNINGDIPLTVSYCEDLEIVK